MIKEAVSVDGPSNTAKRGGQDGSQLSTLPDLRQRPGRSVCTGQQDPVIIEATRSGSDRTTTAARCVTNGAQGGAGGRDGKVGQN